jgi:hypothetical protein
MHLAEYRDQWQALVKREKKFKEFIAWLSDY